MAFSVAYVSNINLFANDHFRRRCLRFRHHDVTKTRRQSCSPSVSLAIVLQPREFTIFSRAAAGDGGPADVYPGPSAMSKDIEASKCNANSGEGYIGLFIQMLGLDHNLVDREHAVVTLWKYSDGGKDFIDVIMKFPGCVNLVLSLLKSDNPSTCEAAAGLLRNISSVNLYRDIIAESGVIEEIAWLLHRSFLALGVKEHCLCTLWNLSIDEKPRIKIAQGDLLRLLVKLLDDEEIKVKEAAGGVLANLSLSLCNHCNMVEAGVIPKMANIFKSDAEGLKLVRKSAKTALLELSKDDYYRVLIIEEGLIQVPLIGAAAYESLRPQSHSWPSLPDGTELERTSRTSRYGATELLLGLGVHEKNINLDEAKINAIIGRSQQQFLARIGAIEDGGRRSEADSSLNQQHTLLPWIDGVARLVLFLGLEDVSAITRAARSIADVSISEHLRISFKEAGAIKHLVRLLSHDDETVQEAVVYALDKLSLSYEVLQTIEVESTVHPLVDIIKRANVSESLLEKIVNILHRVIDPGKCTEKKLTFQLHDKLLFGSDKKAKSLDNSLNEDAITRASETSSMFELISRERVIDSDVVKYLVRILKTSSPNLQTKIVSIFEHLSSFEPYVMMLTDSDIESGLHAIFQNLPLNGTEEVVDNQLELNNTLVAEEIGLSVAAASRLLTKLLDFEQFRHTMNAAHLKSALRDALRSNIPLHTKDWVAACLVKLESKATSGLDMVNLPIGLEVIIYDTIPRLVEQMSTSSSLESRQTAAIELNEVISKGGVECSRAVAAAGGIFPLVKLIEEGSGGGMEACLSILYNLSMDDENHPAMVSAGVIPVLKRIVLSEGPQWTPALRLLRTLPT